MRINWIRLHNYRSFEDSERIELEDLNVLIGKNNSGKSTILRAIAQLQGIYTTEIGDIRKESESAIVQVGLKNMNQKHFQVGFDYTEAEMWHNIKGGRDSFSEAYSLVKDNVSRLTSKMTTIEPNNFIYPYMSKRKVTDFDQSINDVKTHTIAKDLVFLNARIDNLADEEHPKALEYSNLCKKVLGFKIGAFSSRDGKQAGIRVGQEKIPIESMGEGVPNIIGLITMLCSAKDQLFLIEELENDIHPEALKALLDTIIEKSKNNQFIISTHSHIVAQRLGAAPNSKVYSIELSKHEKGAIPTSSIKPLQTTDERKLALEKLGYELGDFDLWSGWLFLEEASAEAIIKEFLIPLFTPRLEGRLRTFSTRGTANIVRKFESFNSLFVFTHLSSHYINKAWVVADGDSDKDRSGSEAIQKLKNTYCFTKDSQWRDDCFTVWSEHDFEKYYPVHFQEKVTEILSLNDKSARRAKKNQLCDEVKAWCRTKSKEELKNIFSESAQEVIDKLTSIEGQLFQES